MPTSNTRKAPKLAATSASGCTPCYPRQMETAPDKRRSNLLFTACFQLVEKTLKNFRQVAFGVTNFILPQTNGAEFQILSYLCPLLCTGGGEFVQEGEASLSWFYSTRIINYSQFIETFKVKTTSILKWHFKLETAIVTLMDNPTNRCSSHWEHKEQLEKTDIHQFVQVKNDLRKRNYRSIMIIFAIN